jgi:hypothetical protein
VLLKLDPAHNATALALRAEGYHCQPRAFYQDLPSTLVWAWHVAWQ